MGFSRGEYCPSDSPGKNTGVVAGPLPGDLSNSEIEPATPAAPSLQGILQSLSYWGSPLLSVYQFNVNYLSWLVLQV